MMRAHPSTTVAFLLAALLVGCDEADDPTAPPAYLARAVQDDVEALIGGSMAGWWRAAHGEWPGPALSTAADAHTSSWRNWGMLDAGMEPRQPLRLERDYRFNFTVQPWVELYRTLVAARDGLVAIDQGVQLGEGGADTDRARAFGAFMQGLALGTLAELYDEAYILDETTDPAALTRAPYPEVASAALAKLDDAIGLAGQSSFVVPAEWVAFGADMDQDGLARLARSWKARIRASVPRSPGERTAVDWTAVAADASAGITVDWFGRYDGNWEENWAFSIDKLWTGSVPIWARMDYRTIGPADASGAWVEWINAPPAARRPFPIDTDDRRVTGGSPESSGIYMDFHAETAFRPQRGRDHFSMYADTRWRHLLDAEGVGDYVDFPVKELAFLRAEALYRTGDRAGAMAIVNQWRAHGGLPAFASPSQPAPGGARCVPRMPDGSCGDLWEAFKYEKRIELFHYGPYTEYLDDRGWGDLVAGTFTELPAPDIDLLTLLQEIYDEADAAAAAELANETSFEGLHRKREAVDRYDRTRAADPGQVGAG
ncbi:MAG: hypothetical protein PVI57_20725 [Gemmatimonadota bacterium]|jgi:hypothetical protein